MVAFKSGEEKQSKPKPKEVVDLTSYNPFSSTAATTAPVGERKGAPLGWQERKGVFIGECNEELEQLMDYLLEMGADPDFTDADGHSTLFMAVHYKRGLSLVEKLLAKGGSGSLVVDDGAGGGPRSCVDSAHRLQAPDILKALLLSGALPTVDGRFDAEESMLDFARKQGKQYHGEVMQALARSFWVCMGRSNTDGMEAILLHGLCLNHVDSQRRSPLFVAVEQKASLAVVELLLRYGANPNGVDCAGTPMCVFPLVKHDALSLRVVRLLCEHGLDPKAEVSDTKQTIMEFAQRSAYSSKALQYLERAAKVATLKSYNNNGTDDIVTRQLLASSHCPSSKCRHFLQVHSAIVSMRRKLAKEEAAEQALAKKKSPAKTPSK